MPDDPTSRAPTDELLPARGPVMRDGLPLEVVKGTLLGLAYLVAAQLSLHLALVQENITPLWPPTGIAVVALLLYGLRLWPAVAIAALIVNLPITASVLDAMITAVGNTLAPVVAAALLRRLGFHPRIDRVRDALALVVVAMASTLISSTIGAGVLIRSGVAEDMSFLTAWSVWWAGDAMGILVVAPFLLILITVRTRLPRSPLEVVEIVGLFLLLIVVSLFVVTSTMPILFVILPVLGWAAWRFQQEGAAPAALIVSVIATWAAVAERGSFAGTTLLHKMLTLHALNAAVAFTSLFFAAVVTERLRARRALEAAAADLEERVLQRTAELSTTNVRLHAEVRERLEAETRLRNSERLLEEAQGLAQLGSWEWDIRSGTVTWSEEMYRIYDVPSGTPITFERAIEAVAPDDRAQIQANVTAALEERTSELPDIEYQIVRGDGTTRLLIGHARLAFNDDGSPARMVGSVQDVTERRELEREQRIAGTLQRALLPQQLPELDGLTFASRYLPAEEGSAAAGGDWYDVIELPDGAVALVIGDVAGHGAEAASVMGQARMAVRAFSLEGHPPAVVVGLVDPTTSELRFVNAGHPPALLVDAAGEVEYLSGVTGLPLGVAWDIPYEESTGHLHEGSTLVLFTDGLVDRRDVAVNDGMERLRAAVAARTGADIDDLTGELLDLLVPPDASDDVAILSARLAPTEGDRMHIRFPADPGKLAGVRRRFARWLARREVVGQEAEDLVLACSEACANAIEHAYGPAGGDIELTARIEDGEVVLVVRDFGRWRSSRSVDRGRGLLIIEACTDSHSVSRGAAGTELRMVRALRPTVTA
jgi:integral membrane sensor domain MASE1/anti-sigma regulatory factor (Ser/Thr protein kinase)